MSMRNPERVVVACVAEDRQPFELEVEYLFKTLRYFGGALAVSQCIAYFLRSADPGIVERLVDLDVQVKIVKPVDDRCPHANKIRMLDDKEDFDYLVALDTDIVVARDFSSFLKQSAIGAKPVDHDPLTFDQWRSLFEYFGLEFPSSRYRTSFTLSQTIPCFNSGVLLIPRQYVSTLSEIWAEYVHKLLEAYEELHEIAEHSFFTDQFALSLALASGQLPHRALPLEMNFPTHSPVHTRLSPERLSPYLLHYHHRLSASSEILYCSYANVNRVLDEINKRLTFL
jgi:hypothetical protein